MQFTFKSKVKSVGRFIYENHIDPSLKKSLQEVTAPCLKNEDPLTLKPLVVEKGLGASLSSFEAFCSNRQPFFLSIPYFSNAIFSFLRAFRAVRTEKFLAENEK